MYPCQGSHPSAESFQVFTLQIKIESAYPTHIYNWYSSPAEAHIHIMITSIISGISNFRRATGPHAWLEMTNVDACTIMTLLQYHDNILHSQAQYVYLSKNTLPQCFALVKAFVDAHCGRKCPCTDGKLQKPRCCRCTLAPNPKDLASAMHPCHHARNKHKCLRPSHQWFSPLPRNLCFWCTIQRKLHHETKRRRFSGSMVATSCSWTRLSCFFCGASAYFGYTRSSM